MKYCDRKGNRWEENSGQDRFLSWVYAHSLTRRVIKCLTFPCVSRFFGRLLKSSLSKALVGPFVRANKIDLSLYEPCSYASYNDFFTRKIRPGLRPVNLTGDLLISPCDGKLSVYPISSRSVFYIKNSAYTVESLTRSKKLARKYEGGWCVLIRLTVDDYHRYCYVDSGKKTKNYHISGCLHTVNPAAVEQIDVYKENSREFTMIRSQNFGDMVQMEVGALMVGKIRNHQGAGTVVRGEEKGYFEFGGSTVILLLEGSRVAMDRDLCQNTALGYETKVQMGEVIGHAQPGRTVHGEN